MTLLGLERTVDLGAAAKPSPPGLPVPVASQALTTCAPRSHPQSRASECKTGQPVWNCLLRNGVHSFLRAAIAAYYRVGGLSHRNYSFTVLEARGLKLRCQPSSIQRPFGASPRASSSFWGLLVSLACGSPTLISASAFTRPFPLCVLKIRAHLKSMMISL